MPKRFKFSVIHSTSEEAKYRISELNIHGPTVKGWRSKRDCQYPQEVVLRLEKRCILNKIQILAHQYLIPSKIELFSNNGDSNLVNDVSSISWEYIGYITLSSNDSTEFKSRELKSANVPKTEATFIKLHLHDNHENVHNQYNQVSIIAINVIGSEIDQKTTPTQNDDPQMVKLHDIINNPEYISPFDDLAFEMYVATDIAKIIRDMEIQKYLAVINERFEYARKLKQAMLTLRTAGEKLGKYELEKRHAIELEDYEKAMHKKNQIEQFRRETFQELSIDELLETNGICPKNDECMDEPENKNLLSPTMVRIDRRSSSPNQPHSNQSPMHIPRHQSPKMGSPSMGSPTMNRGSFRRRNKSAGAAVKSTYEMYEEKPLPALRHSQTNEFLRECQLETDYKTTSKLTEREKKQASLPILVFGNDLVEKFYSKHYTDKEEGLRKLKDELLMYDNNKMHTANKTARAAIFLLHRALRDKVFSVYNLANEVIRLFFVQFVPGRVVPAEVSRSVDKLLPELLTKSGDTSARIHHMAVHTILTMADVKSVSGLTCRTLSEFGSSGLHHPAEAVRKVSERILVLVYKVNPRMVRKQLPPDDDITRRNLLYRQLFHEFDNIDFQRKREVLEKNRLMQQAPVNAKPDCFSPEPTETKSEISKCISSGNIENMANSFGANEANNKTNYALAKSQSGGNIGQTNGHQKSENDRRSLSSASGVSTPSNNSQKEEDERHCIFCNQPEKTILLVSNSMNSHYWRSCPMLVRCRHCSQVIEVASLSEHL